MDERNYLGEQGSIKKQKVDIKRIFELMTTAGLGVSDLGRMAWQIEDSLFGAQPRDVQKDEAEVPPGGSLVKIERGLLALIENANEAGVTLKRIIERIK